MSPKGVRGAPARAPRDESAAGERTDECILAVEPAAFDARGAAQFLCISRAHLMRLVASGRAPAGVKLGTRRIFPRAELAAWLAAGCPVRWEAIRRAEGGR